MNDTSEENTDYIRTWAVNASDHYEALTFAASVSPEALRALVYDIWTKATAENHAGGAYYGARNMSEADYDSVNWAEVAATLLSC